MLRKVLSNFWFIHFLVILGGFALLGFAVSENNYLLLGVYFSFCGAVCGAVIRIIDRIK